MQTVRNLKIERRVFAGIRLSAALLLLATTGCASKGLMNPLEAFKKDRKNEQLVATETDQIIRVECLWQPGEGLGLTGQPARGAAGKIYFFKAGTDQPVRIAGDVRIFVFDNMGSPDEQGQAIHQFNFVNQVWNTYQVDTQLGPAYQIFIPYTRPGSHAADMALRVKHTPKQGLPTYSEILTVSLGGTAVKEDQTKEAAAAETAEETTAQSSVKKSIIIRDGKGQVHDEESEHRLAQINDKLKQWQVEQTAKQPTSAIQQASYEETQNADPRDDRIRQLEDKLELLLQERKKRPNAPKPAVLDTGESSPVPGRPVRKRVLHPLRDLESETEAVPQSERHTQTRPEGGAQHPLDDMGGDVDHPLAGL